MSKAVRWDDDDAVSHDPVRLIPLDNGWTEINEILCGYYAIGDKWKLKVFILQHTVTPTAELLEIASWNDDDTTAHDPLRMRITKLT
jgi:hypothetical protein